MIRWQLKSRQMHQNGIPRVCFYFCYTERNSELYSLPWNGSERNSESLLIFFYTERNSEHLPLLRNGAERNPEGLLLFLSHCIEFQSFSLPRNDSELSSESILFRGTAGIPLEQTNCSIHSAFRARIFLSEISNPNPDPDPLVRGMDLDPDSAPDLDPSVIKQN